ncbi:MAG: alpha/beta hydrolase family protein [Ruegeria sp.]|uniref:alpha/beta hydrolase family protein n=1 Tax=Ruegeria sp. TaxID=1879320 RepID=UPI00349EE8A7
MITQEQQAALETLAKGLSTPPRLPVLWTPADYDMTFEEVSFTTADGVAVSAWFMPGTSGHVILSNHFSPGNKYGFAGHMVGLGFAGGFEVNFLPRYKALVDAGYSVLAYDLRGHGGSADGEGGISGVGYHEWQEVIAALDYVRSRDDTTDISLYVMCMGANATFNAMDKHPEAFEGIKSMIAIAPLKGRTTIERNCEHMGIPADEGVKAFEPIYNGITGLTVDDHNIIPKALSITIPTFFVQVRDDMNSHWQDVQEMFDLAPVADKKIFYIEGTPWRFRGYSYFSENPGQMVEWFSAHK